MKKIIRISSIISALVLITGCSLLQTKTIAAESGTYTVYKNKWEIPYNDPSVRVPNAVPYAELEAAFADVFIDPIRQEFCKDTGIEAERVTLYRYKADTQHQPATGWGDASVTAYVCSTQYIIEELNPAGVFYYGPFALETNE